MIPSANHKVKDWLMDYQRIQDIFLQQLPEDQARIENAWKALRSSEWDAEKSTALILATHRLIGGALSIGYNDIGNAARQFETTLKSTGATPDWVTLESLYAELRRAIDECKGDTTAFQKQMKRPIRHTSSLHEKRSTGMIYIVEDDLMQAENLAAQLGFFGYTVSVFTQLGELRSKLHQQLPTAILMDIIFPEGELAGADEIKHLHEEFGDQLPVFFISVRDDAVARIQAIRAGGMGYFAKPVDIGALTDELDKLFAPVDPQPYRVLIVDDSEVQAELIARHLREAKIETAINTCALDVLHTLEEFNPDLLLLDLYMPECNGLELAQMIRQIKAFVGLPIVFLSAEADRDKQLVAVSQGGDDFLTKPIKPDHLISALSSRIERYRQLRALMLRDSLTGLFNHTTVLEYLVQEFAHAERKKQFLSIAMIDVDYFKKVNDTYGHAMGDKVLRSLSHMLSNRLRTADIIGRYGGDEFLIILPNTDTINAHSVIDELRQAFAQITYICGGTEFHVTLSCGIASFPEQESPSALREAADQAMYSAKRRGRNQVAVGESVVKSEN